MCLYARKKGRIRVEPERDGRRTSVHRRVSSKPLIKHFSSRSTSKLLYSPPLRASHSPFVPRPFPSFIPLPSRAQISTSTVVLATLHSRTVADKFMPAFNLTHRASERATKPEKKSRSGKNEFLSPISSRSFPSVIYEVLFPHTTSFRYPLPRFRWISLIFIFFLLLFYIAEGKSKSFFREELSLFGPCVLKRRSGIKKFRDRRVLGRIVEVRQFYNSGIESFNKNLKDFLTIYDRTKSFKDLNNFSEFKYI